MVCSCRNRGLEKFAKYYKGCVRDVPSHGVLEFYACCSCDSIFRKYVTYRGESATDICRSSEFERNRDAGWREIHSDYIPYEGRLTKQEIIDNLGTGYWGEGEEVVLLKRKCDHNLEKIAESQPKAACALYDKDSSWADHAEYFECKSCGLLFYKDHTVGNEKFNAFMKELLGNGHIIPEEERLKEFKYKGCFLELELTRDEIVSNAPKCSGSAYGIRNQIRKLRR